MSTCPSGAPTLLCQVLVTAVALCMAMLVAAAAVVQTTVQFVGGWLIFTGLFSLGAR